MAPAWIVKRKPRRQCRLCSKSLESGDRAVRVSNVQPFSKGDYGGLRYWLCPPCAAVIEQAIDGPKIKAEAS